jgi:hypothetical protein
MKSYVPEFSYESVLKNLPFNFFKDLTSKLTTPFKYSSSDIPYTFIKSNLLLNAQDGLDNLLSIFFM